MVSSGGAPGPTRHIRIAHDIPGRLRLRLPRQVMADGIPQAVLGVPGVVSCDWSPLTRSLLVVYGPEASAGAIVAAVRGAAAKGALVDVEPGPSPMTSPSPSFGAVVSGAFGELDRRVRRATRDSIGLGGLLPSALAIWAVREVVLGRAAPLAWSTALWYAHGLFRDYNTPPS